VGRSWKVRTGINSEGAEIKSFVGCVWVQCGSVCKQKKFGKRTKGLSELSNPESLDGCPTDSETEIK
jgi:hypothetical protein